MKKKEVNLLELKPVRRREWEETADGNAVILIPKFPQPWMRWILRFLREKNFRVNLDEFGTFVWRQCDGSTTVESIAEKFRDAYTDQKDIYQRLNKFIAVLERDGLIRIQ